MRHKSWAFATLFALAMLASGPPVRGQEVNVLGDYRQLIETLRSYDFIGCEDRDLDVGGGDFASLFRQRDHQVVCDRREQGQGFTHIGHDKLEISLTRVGDAVWKVRFTGLEDSAADMGPNRDRALQFLRTFRDFDPASVDVAERIVLARRSHNPTGVDAQAARLRIFVSTARTDAGRGNIWISVTNQTVAPDNRELISYPTFVNLLIALSIIMIAVGLVYVMVLRSKMARGEKPTQGQAWLGLLAGAAMLLGAIILLLAPM